MNGARLRVGIAGCGVVTRRHHLPAILGRDDLLVSCLYDPDTEAAKDVRKRFGLSCSITEGFEDFIRNNELDLVHICSPGPCHYEQALQALEAGRNVLLEKPPVYTMKELESLSETAVRLKRKIGVILNNRYRRVVEEIKSHIESGRLGTICKVHLTHHANLVFSESPWLWDQNKSKYLVYEFGIHFFDLLVYLFGDHEEVLSVISTGQANRKDLTTDIQVSIKFRSGVLATVDITQDSTRHSTYVSRMDVFGTAADALVRYFPPLVRLTSGIEHPAQILWSEISSFTGLAFGILSKRYFQERNRGHERIVGMLSGWIKGEADFPLELAKIAPTIRLLEEISSRIPAYN